MPQVHYPFIDVAVHPAVRARFAAGEAVVLFSRDLGDVLWANGEGARLFGYGAIYDMIDAGPERGGVAFRQLSSAAAQLGTVGDKRGFIMRVTSGFTSAAVPAEVNLIFVGREEAIMFSAAALTSRRDLSALLAGFDDPDTHMALLGADGEVLVASAGFHHVGVTSDTARALIVAASNSPDGLVKRPIPSGSGYLPAAIGRLADDLFLLFCVETAIGRMDAPESEPPVAQVPVPAPVIEPVVHRLNAPGGMRGDKVVPESDSIRQADGMAVVPGATIPEADSRSVGRPLADTELDSATDDRIEESEAEEELGYLAALDGARVEDVGAETGTAVVDDGDPTELDADIAEATAMDEAAVAEGVDAVGSVDSPGEGDVAASATSTGETRIDADHDLPRELDADIAEASADRTPARDEAYLPAFASGVEQLADIVAATEANPEESDARQFADEGAENAYPTELDADIAQASDEAMPSDLSQLAEETEAPGEFIEAGGTVAETVKDRDGDAGEDQVAAAARDNEVPAEGASQSMPQSPSSTEEISDAPAGESEPVRADGTAGEVPPAASTPSAMTSSTPEAAHLEPPFSFDRGARPIRFVWKLDANGVFAEVSEEFPRAVGPHAGDIVGRSFRDLVARFGLDPESQILTLLDRRDTWSGRTLKWPIEGTELVVPVDLAALPTYTRSREFDGFRGFGIIRVGDAETDPDGRGLKIASDAARPTEPENPAYKVPEGPNDEFQGEVPALDIVSNPLATFADKVVRIGERRGRVVRDGLSPSEQAALKEIARQLEPFGKRPNEDILKTSSGLLQTEDTADAADEHIEEALEHDGDAEIHATEQDTGGTLGSDFLSDTVDEQAVQSLFEDLGNGPGLTSYAIDQVPMAILIHAGDRLIEMNAEFRRLTGFADIADLDRAGGLDALITRREGPDAGVYLVRADGTQVLVSARLQSVRYEGSSALMLALSPAVGTLAVAAAEPQVVGESETARRIAALQVEVEELRSILETATDGVVVLDTEGRIRSMNRSAAALFNFDDAEIIGRPFAMLFAHGSQKSVQDYLAGLAGHGVASVLNDGREVIGREAAGGFIPLFMTMGRMPGSNSYCAVIRDITQWKRSEEELRAAKRAAETANQHKSDFLARVSHEIRTPLNAIIGFADMIATEHFGPAGHPRYAEYACDIGRSGRHVLDIVNDLLDISKIEAGEMDLEFAAVGLNDCVSEAVSLVQPQANAQRVIIRTALSQAVPDVVADLRSIKQIALNILANAIRYTPSGGQIVVSTAYEPSGSVTLRIRDTGVGMSKAELEQAMKPFGQVAPGTRQRGDGTGLGLPLTKAMTEANRATFAIHSSPNEGTLVEINFPPQRVLAD